MPALMIKLSEVCLQNCRKNIDFYKEQIDKLEEKMEELERLKEAYEYY